ncbi:hypothetical protein EV401DRAFT_1876405 [Pisolithus croceorrhizus]|nr:hypothetical protein EV401DRAFT_1876405 [Pisolithus croceorrhizus]
MPDENLPPIYTEHATTEIRVPAQPQLVNSAYVRNHRTQTKVHLVTPSQLKGHLALLHAFHELKKKVQEGVDDRFPEYTQTLGGERRWTWFVALAVERFERWCITIRHTDVEWMGLPPIDVVMVWHAYLLNPRQVLHSNWYAEDIIRIPALETLAKYNRAMTTCLDCPMLLTSTTPGAARVQTWQTRTGTPYDPFDAMLVLIQRSVTCPKCERSFPVAFLDPSGRGYTQSSFQTSCPCGLDITKDVLGMVKFLRNILESEAPGKYFAGTLYTPQDACDMARADKIRRMVLHSAPLAKALHKAPASGLPPGGEVIPTVRDVMAENEWDAVKLRRQILSGIRAPKIRMLGAYTDDRMFSIDLVGAVLRQSSFTQKMHDLGWTEPGFFDSEEDAVVLKHCIARYKGFLGLMAQSSGSFFVPTLDIDLAWHTHQLIAQRYEEECMELVGRYVNHDDKVEEDKLATSFDVTCRAWQDQYGLPYMFCGCALPEESIGQRLRRAFGCLQVNDGESSRGHDYSSLVPSAGMGAAATHPSDHNAVFLMHKRNAGMFARRKRQARIEARRARELKRIERESEKEGSAGVEGSRKFQLDSDKRRRALLVVTPAMPLAQRVREKKAFGSRITSRHS